jgi:hypothetical protein
MLINNYPVTEAGETNFVQSRQGPPSNEITVKVIEKSGEPPDHDLVVLPPLLKLLEHVLMMLFSQCRQYLIETRKG